MAVNGIALGAVAAGSVFAYAAIKGKSITASFQAIMQGKSPGTLGQTTPITDITAALQEVAAAGAAAAGATGQQGGSASQNRAIGKLLASSYGWDKDPYWSALVSLWDSESGWSNTIWNTSASCGNGAYAYGIVQACGHGERKAIPGHGSVCPYPAGNSGNPPQCGGTSNASAQISWGLSYIKQNYGDPTRVPHGGY